MTHNALPEEIEKIIADCSGAGCVTDNAVTRHSLQDGTVVWVKRPVTAKRTGWHRIQHCLARAVPLAILRPTVSKGGDAALKAEHDRIKSFADAGMVVPDILAFNGNVLVTKDAGRVLSDILGDLPDTDERKALLLKATDALSFLHSTGLCHGRPHVRDMVSGAKGIGFIDLEENPLDVMTLPQAQARDIWLFLTAAARYADAETLEELARNLTERATPETRKELRKFVRLLRPMRRFLGFLNFPVKEVRQSIAANNALETLLL